MKNFSLPLKMAILLLAITSFKLFGIESVEKWGLYEITLNGPSKGNPYMDIQLGATFTLGGESQKVKGFYDGEGVYKIRFMPQTEGTWTYVTSSNNKKLNYRKGTFTCVANTGDNHGPVRVANTYHFAHADGTPFKPFGTTLYLWHQQDDELQARTLETLKESPFNKLRMLVFPWGYLNPGKPYQNVFAVNDSGKYDHNRFNPEYWHNLEKCIFQMQELGMEADMIVINGRLPEEKEEFYMDYLTARLAPIRNVWWTLANEYNLDKSKTIGDWDRHGYMLDKKDIYEHLLTNHNHPAKEFAWDKEYITHIAAQYADQVFVASLRDKYQKPAINDEPQYEGDHFCHWGNISAQEMVHRFWLGAVVGIYTTHGETYAETGWSGPGGTMVGDSPERIAFLKKIMDEAPAEGINNYRPNQFWDNIGAGDINKYVLVYFGPHQPGIWYFDFPEDGSEWVIDLIDPWEMTIEPIDKIFTGKINIKPPIKPNMAIRARKVKEGHLPVKVIFDTDANNELDDQHALAYLVLNGISFDVVGITVNNTSNGGGIQGHFDEAYRVLSLCNMQDKHKIYKGATKNFDEIKGSINQETFDGSEAVNFIIETSRDMKDEKLVLLPVGKLTNVALALMKAPDIADKLRIVWLGSNYPRPGEYNMDNDIPSMNYVLEQDVEFELVTVRYAVNPGEPTGTSSVLVPYSELYEKMPGMGPKAIAPVNGRQGSEFTTFGDYSVNLFKHSEGWGGHGRSLFDLAAVAIVKNPRWGESYVIPAPVFKDGRWVEQPWNERKIKVWQNFNRDDIIDDMFKTLRKAGR